MAKDSNLSAFFHRLRHLLFILDLNQKDLSDLTGIDQRTISRWRNEANPPGDGSLFKISKATGCNFEWLAAGKGEMLKDEGKTTKYEKTTDNFQQTIKEEEAQQVRMYRKLAKMDADVLHEIQTWLEDMERIKPGFTGWFRLEFQNRFPEFDDWKEKITKNSKTGTGY